MKFLSSVFLISLSTTSAAANAFPRFARKIIQNAKQQIQRRPGLAHGAIGFVLFGTSDALAQQIEASQKEVIVHNIGKLNNDDYSNKFSWSSPTAISMPIEDFDTTRFLSASFIGAFFGGFVYPIAYKHLDRIWKGNDLLSIGKKSLVEVFTVGIFANSVSMASRGILVGKDPYQVATHVRKEMPGVTLNDLKVWFPYNMIAFGVIPAYIRPTT